MAAEAQVDVAAGAGNAPLPRVLLRSSQFRVKREDDWRELEDLIRRAERRGITSLSPQELQSLPLLYRSALSSLSVARSIALDRNMLAYLENLSLRAFLVVYGPRTTLWDGLKQFLSRQLPAAIRSAWPHLLIALLASVAGGVAGFLLTAGNEDWFSSLVPSGLAGGRGVESTREELLTHEIFAPWDGAAHAFALFANTLFQNNSMVGILSFSLGIAGGIPTILLMIYNGLILGAFIAIHYNRGLTYDFLGWLSIHGVTEFMAMWLCASGGLMIAEKILFPDRYSRVQSLAIHGRTAARVGLGGIMLFFAAAILEGCFRQLVQSTELRYAIGWGMGLLWVVYFTQVGREGAADGGKRTTL
jgi:uncharacterized membrane protein SpoIIM required for sporulation